jgi:hypothetical protein
VRVLREDVGASSTLVRTGLVLAATGIVSAASIRHAIDEGGDTIFAYGFLLYLVLVVVAVPRRPFRYASLLAFLAFAAMYLSAATDPQADHLGLSLYVVAGGLAYFVTPPRLRVLTVAALASWTPALRFFSSNPLIGDYPLVAAVAAILALLFLVGVLIARDRVDDDERVRRIGLGLLGVATIARISERHYIVSSPGTLAPDDLWALVVVVVLPILAVANVRRPVRDALATGVALAAYVLIGISLILGKGYHVDSVAVVHRAADLFVAGQDPYASLDVDEALRHFGLDPVLATHLEDGSDVTSYNYPALSFLVPAPFVALGLGDIRFIYLAEIVLLTLVLVRKARVPWRPLVTAAVVGSSVIMRQNVLAGVDPLWAILSLLAFVFVARRWSSPILIGLACAVRQPAWFFVPFYLVAVWRAHGRREALRRLGIAAVAAVVPNLPFLVTSPGAFLGGVLLPTIGPLEPYGVGLIRFAIDGDIPLFARGAYGALSLAVLAALLVLLYRRWRMLSNGTVVFPSVGLWFAWRSLQNYFSFAAVFAMTVDESTLEVRPLDAPADRPDELP